MDLTPQEFRAQLATMIDDKALVDATVAQYAMRWEANCLPKVRKPRVEIAPAKTEEAIYAEEMEIASALLLDAINTTRTGRNPNTPKRLIWRMRSGLDASNCSGANSYLFEHREPKKLMRDPCPRCGARGDFDCGHAPVRGGRLMAL